MNNLIASKEIETEFNKLVRFQPIPMITSETLLKLGPNFTWCKGGYFYAQIEEWMEEKHGVELVLIPNNNIPKTYHGLMIFENGTQRFGNYPTKKELYELMIPQALILINEKLNRERNEKLSKD